MTKSKRMYRQNVVHCCVVNRVDYMVWYGVDAHVNQSVAARVAAASWEIEDQAQEELST